MLSFGFTPEILNCAVLQEEDETEEERLGDVVANLGIEKALERDSRREAE